MVKQPALKQPLTFAVLLVLLGLRPAALTSDWAVRGGGTWVHGNGLVRQTDNATVDAKKYVLAALNSAGDQDILAQVRVDSFPSSFSRIGVSLRTHLASGYGYNFVLLAGNRVGFLADTITFGTTCSYPWSYGNWYWMKLTSSGGTLTGRIWADGQRESQATVCTQSGWSYFPSGAPGLNGGSFGETASFNNVVAGSFYDSFNTNAPPAPPRPPARFLTSGQFVSQVQGKASALGFDLGRFIDIMHTTAQSLVCTNPANICKVYTPGTFAVVPSAYYGVATWMRDSTWALGALNNVDHFASLTSRFAAAGNGSAGQIATLIHNQNGPWFGAGGWGNPVPDDDSQFMFVIAARLGGQTAGSQRYLNNVYTWIRTHADATGKYRATSFGWEDSFYPLGASGPASVTVSANMQGLYAVALRALKDMGVGVPQPEIDKANAQYASLTTNGRMRAYEGSDIVDVSSLMGDALSLFIWNQPLLSDSVVQNTIASFAEVYDASGTFVGYKVLSAPDGSFLPPGAFPIDNGGAGNKGGVYLNGGSWMLYEALALYAGARHDTSMRDAYLDRLVRRMASELRAGPGGVPANKSNEFVCTAPDTPDAPCRPTGSAETERADFGWNTFVVRLLSNESPTDGGMAAPFGVVDTPAQGLTGVAGSISVTGWALDDSEVTAVRILRDPVGAEPGGTPVFLGNAVLVTGARPDVAAAFPSYLLNDRAGWGYMLLTNMLPNQGNGTYTLHAYADDGDGHGTLLGSRTITLANATATKPFGALDTPAQGATISGSAYVNFGWVLTPQPKSIPTSGSTITVFVDGIAMGNPAYNNFRGDVAALFPGLVNSNGAVGVFHLDTTRLSNGLHTIAWVVTDSAGASEGIGSRYFIVQNGS